MKLGATLFYLFLGILAWVLSAVFHVTPWRIPPRASWLPHGASILLGLGLGLAIVVISRILDRYEPFKRLNALIAHSLPHLGFADIVLLAVLSAFAEELLFRGVLLQLVGIHLSSLVFGLLHYGGRRDFLLWGVMGWLMGYLLAGLFLVTGSLLAPVLAHFTVNYFNLHRITGQTSLHDIT